MVIGVVQTTGPTIVVECAPATDPAQRVYAVIDHGQARVPQWWMTLRAPALGERVVELPLPDARVTRLDGGLALSSASKNGGLAVELTVGGDRPILDVFVNFELEVNVWRDLSPDVDRMNTHGPHPDPACRLVQAPPQ